MNRSVAFAADLVSAAVVSANYKVAHEAAVFILDTAESLTSPSLRRLAETVLTGGEALPQDLATNYNASDTPGRIREIRKQIVSYPHDAMQWMDLAHLYMTSGLLTKAERPIKVALSLAKNNRYILRSAARFYVHRRDFGQAHRILRNAVTLTLDPWIAAAEIAVAQAGNLAPRAARQAKALLSGEQFPASDLTELSSALATLELASGSTGKARKLSKQALLAPNENSLAQTVWLAGEGVNARVEDIDFSIPLSFEASARNAYAAGDWSGSYSSTLRWLRDQIFSTQPAYMACFLAGGMLEEHEASIQVAEASLHANPNDSLLWTTLGFENASLNRTGKAREALSRVVPDERFPWLNVALHANYGLVNFREGNPTSGRLLYSKAVEAASALHNSQARVSALIYWASEEINYGHTEFADRLLDDIAKEPLVKDAPTHKELFSRLQRKRNDLKQRAV